MTRNSPLPPDLRNLLAKTVLEARRTAEAAAKQSLEALAVDRAEPHDSMALGERALRNRLRARGRQLGDRRDRHARTQEIDRLVHEVAYEQWHRMLFARFLAENGLLVEPESGVPVPLDECEDLAREMGEDMWALVGRFAQEMLPGVFRKDDPVLAVALPPEARLKLEDLLESLPQAVFAADDSLGWTYQFWQAERKDDVNRSGVKIGPDELPAVTQLFTERYMVQFLFHNAVGAWRAGKLLSGSDGGGTSDRTEDDLHRAVRIKAAGGYDFSYLRFVREENEAWRPAAGWFEKWPRTAAELRVLDPCCGSGHFLVEGLELLTRLRMEEEGFTVRDAVCVVLRDNLHGLEIDPRCAQIAAFNLAFAAWRLVGEPFVLPRLNVACCGLAPNASESEWMAMATHAESTKSIEGKHDLFVEPSLAATPLQAGMAALHKLFSEAQELGSLIDPATLLGGDLFRADFGTVRKALPEVVKRERKRSPDNFEHAVAADGMARAVELLSDTYTLVITNVPFLARGKQSATLRRFAEAHHPEAKGDLATMFLDRVMRWLGESGTQALVAPQNWLFLKSYRKLRERLLKQRTCNVVSRLGPGAFETIGGHVVNVQLNILSADNPGRDWQMAGLDVSATGGQIPIRAAEKATLLAGSGEVHVHLVKQAEQLANPDAIVAVSKLLRGVPIMAIGRGVHGLKTADDARFKRAWWEVDVDDDDDIIALCANDSSAWQRAAQAPVVGNSGSAHYSGASIAIRLADRFGSVRDLPSATIAGSTVWTRRGVLVGRMSQLPVSLYTGCVFKHTAVVAICDDPKILPALWCYAERRKLAEGIREFNQALAIDSGVVESARFDLDHWRQVAKEQYPHGLPEPYSDDPTQWLFHGHPCGSVVWDEDAKKLAHGPLRTDSTVLQVAVARLLGYRWPAECDSSMDLSNKSRHWVKRSGELDHFADRDGIVCIPAVGGERSAQDRLRELLATAYGQGWSVAVERAMLEDAVPSSPPPLTSGFETISLVRTAGSSTTVPSSGTSGTDGGTASTPWSTTTA